MITYAWNLTGNAVVVRLEGKHVGYIRKIGSGWQYFPLGKNEGGELFPTLDACKTSLEEF